MQLDLFITAPSSAPTLIGLTVKLERPGDHCCDDRLVMRGSKGPHAAPAAAGIAAGYRRQLSASSKKHASASALPKSSRSARGRLKLFSA
jgi:hypothetical protein